MSDTKIQNLFHCGMCGNTYEKGWSDEESLKEAKENFGKPVSKWKDSFMVICDNCYEKVDPKKYPELVKKVKKDL